MEEVSPFTVIEHDLGIESLNFHRPKDHPTVPASPLSTQGAPPRGTQPPHLAHLAQRRCHPCSPPPQMCCVWRAKSPG